MDSILTRENLAVFIKKDIQNFKDVVKIIDINTKEEELHEFSWTDQNDKIAYNNLYDKINQYIVTEESIDCIIVRNMVNNIEYLRNYKVEFVEPQGEVLNTFGTIYERKTISAKRIVDSKNKLTGQEKINYDLVLSKISRELIDEYITEERKYLGDNNVLRTMNKIPLLRIIQDLDKVVYLIFGEIILRSEK